MTYDVTAALNAIGICVFMADIYVEPPEEMEPGTQRRPLELLRFLVHLSDGSRLSTAEQKRCALLGFRVLALGLRGCTSFWCSRPPRSRSGAPHEGLGFRARCRCPRARA